MQNAGRDQSKRNALQRSSYLESLRCGEPCSNICCITMKSGTIRGREIAYCFLRRRKQEGTWEQCSAGNDVAACCDTTGGKLHKSRRDSGRWFTVSTYIKAAG